MKHTLNKFWLLWLCLLLSIFVLKAVSAADDATVTIDPTAPAKVWYRSTLHTLNLWSLTNFATLQESNWRMRFTNWLVAWKDSSVWNSSHAVIGWWEWNQILNNANYAGIWWWRSNKVYGNYGVVWWWESNQANWVNVVVVWWRENIAQESSVVVWWYKNKGIGGWVVLWWNANTGHKNSLAFGQKAIAKEWAFAWNTTAEQNAAKVNASNWILIGTTNKIDWVNLVVDGAVKVEWDQGATPIKWEIRYVGNCFYWYDGSVWHVLNRWNDKNNNNECGAFSTTTAKYCEFGNTILWDWDYGTGYSRPNATNCNSYKNTRVTCNAWILTPSTHKYPYCYTIHAN